MLKLKKQEKQADEITRSLITTIDAKGTVILPESVVKHLDFKIGDKLIIVEENDKIRMEKA
jgi:bifunctional DNA-binding transcriptional regulator/antitoxin component of YhaV-PrlF toxin-antitoxin module